MTSVDNILNVGKTYLKNSIISELLGTPIFGYSNFTTKNGFYRDRLMKLNINQRDRILLNLGNGTIKDLSGASLVNYNREFGETIEGSENQGTDVTRSVRLVDGQGSYTSNIPRYGSVMGGLYEGRRNLYYDDSDNGTFTNKINYYGNGNINSIVGKTKELFHRGKIKTIISKFHTKGGDIDNGLGSAVSAFGMSHGRNLLTYEAESKGLAVNRNGYDDPYCRVWTHHYQYDQINKLIRPFSEDGSFTSIEGLQSDWTFIRGVNGAKKLSDNTVLNKNGFVNIAPSYNTELSKKVDVKHCMFSIENLAWKGYDPYSFEKALSWEQRGPMGGRIMWFPPYDISFTENVSASYNEHVFIGRGEKVFTYSNTDREGTLRFKMVVDHPSIINYYEGRKEHSNAEKTRLRENIEKPVSESRTSFLDVNNIGRITTERLSSLPNPNMSDEPQSFVQSTPMNGPRDTDLLRFFAGCDTLDATSKSLTDEFNFRTVTDKNEKEKVTTVKPQLKTPESPIPDVEVPDKEENGKFRFYVFFPNNYSGKDDPMGGPVDAAAYLLRGTGANFNPVTGEDVPVQFSQLSRFSGTGYEMGDEIGEVSEIYIPNGRFTTSEDHRWYYRVDSDTKGQVLNYTDNYKDTSSYGLNKNADAVVDAFGIDEDDVKVYSFADMAYFLADEGNKPNTGGSANKEIEDIFNEYRILKVNSFGFSNSHGNNASKNVNDRRNDNLAINRARTLVNWLKSFKPFNDSSIEFKMDITSSVGVSSQNVSALDSKKWRSAYVDVTYQLKDEFRLAEQSSVYNETGEESDDFPTPVIEEYVGYNSFVDSDGTVKYKDENGKVWVKDENGNLLLKEVMDEIVERGESVSREMELNNIRYDQEYRFFKVLEENDPLVFARLTDKIKHFDPAFHSMTPEGFNGRLTFLQQCMRQGNTIGASDSDSVTATNLAFGRQPICVLRLGDFYYTKIVITNLGIEYDPLVWDLNSEGIGVQPLIANVNLTFKFIGGSDMQGPINRLQNAMSFNYYANTGVYDNRADEVEYEYDNDHTSSDMGNPKSYNAFVAQMAGS